MSSPQLPQILFETTISNEASAAMSWKEVGDARKDRDAVSKFLESHGLELLREMTAQGVHFATLVPFDNKIAEIIEGLVALTEKPFFTTMLGPEDLSSIPSENIRKVKVALDKWSAKFKI
jgi:hypothetical protein